jgi:hypothetical protein
MNTNALAGAAIVTGIVSPWRWIGDGQTVTFSY